MSWKMQFKTAWNDGVFGGFAIACVLSWTVASVEQFFGWLP